MRCPFCKGDTEQQLIRYVQEYDGQVVIVENVPALVCDQCGETLFRPEIVEKLQRIVWGETPQTREVKVPFYDFEQVA
jgi:YgiT-type zinc finger domain-containing protein